MIFNIKTTDINLIKIFLIFSFICCWFSISSSYDDLLIFKNENILNFRDILNFLRHLSVYFCLFFLFMIMAIHRKKILFKKYMIFYILIAYFISQIIGLFFTNNPLVNISFVISALSTILTLLLIDSFFSPKEKKFFLFISFVILNLVFLLTFAPLFIEFLNGGGIFYGVHQHSDFFLNKYSPRSSGLARTALIILILIEYFEYDYKKYSYQLIFIKIPFLVFILLFQSRTILFLTLIVYSFIFISKYEMKIKTLIKFITIYFFIPMLIFFILSSLNSFKKSKKINLNQTNSQTNSSFSEHVSSKEFKILRTISKDFSSGRFEDWKEILKKMKGKNIYYGFGAQGDRYLINQSASNALLYAYASSGLIGLILFAIFVIMGSFKFIKIILYNLKNDSNAVPCSLILMILTLRSLLESSFAVYGIDLVVYITVLSFLFDRKISIEDIKNKLL